MKLKGILIDLHLHLDGSLPIETVKKLAMAKKLDLPPDEELIKMLSISEDCNNLTEYLTKFELPLKLLQNAPSLTIAAYDLCEELKRQGLMYAEIRFAPQLHTREGLSQKDAISAVIRGIDMSSMNCGLILCCMRGNNNFKENFETVVLAKRFLKNGVNGLDLAGDETRFKTSDFNELFNIAKGSDIPLTIHCGEGDGVESIRSALEWSPKRFGHGVRVLEDMEFVDKISKEDIYFELCPSSNINTCLFSDYSNFPVEKMMEKGLKPTINTDNITVSNTCIENEYNHMIEVLSLDTEKIRTLLINSVNASFANATLKEEMKEKIKHHNF